MMVYVCSVHKQAKFARHREWSAAKYHAAFKHRNRVQLVESVCPSCIQSAKVSLNSLLQQREAAYANRFRLQQVQDSVRVS